MKKWTLLLLLLMAFVSMNAQNQMKIAVMDFKAGVGVNQADTEGLSDMLINTLFKTGKFEIIERTQIDQARKELKFQETEPTYEQIAQMGRFLGVESVLIGTVNKLFDEYNVDVRAIDVESAKVVTTAGRSLSKKTASAFRRMTEKLGKELAENLIEEKPVIKVVEEKNKVTKPEKVHFRKSGFTLRPEIGLNIPISEKAFEINRNFEYAYEYDAHYGYSHRTYEYSMGISFPAFPSVELGVGYQAGPHLFIGIIGGYGGKIVGYYDDVYNTLDGFYGKTRVDYVTHSFPIKTDFRWYIIDHQYSFLVDLQAGLNIFNYGKDPDLEVLGDFNKETKIAPSIKLGVGFAVGNVEAIMSGGYENMSFPGGRYGTEHVDIWKLSFSLAYRLGNVIKKWW